MQTNYSRSLRKQVQERGPRDEQERSVVALSIIAQKFQLPEGGILFEDPSLRAIDESMELHLPYPQIALEYPKRGFAEIVFAEEVGECIRLRCANRSGGSWWVTGIFELPRAGYLDRSVSGYMGFPGIAMFDVETQETLAMDDNYTCARVLLSFLNALACSNVHTLRVAPAKPKAKTALPFDAYHLLTVDLAACASGGLGLGTHRSPREHLRRGHIRRLQSGARIWVNAAVVNAGVGGQITKDYRFRAAA